MKLDWYKSIWTLSLLLAGVFILLAVFSVIQIRQITLPLAVSPEPVGLPLVITSNTSERVAEINLLDRPVFWQGRRPLVVDESSEPVSQPAFEPEPVVLSSLPESLTDFRLRGVFFWDENKGMVYDLAEQRHRAMLGDKVAGWVLTEIDASGITLHWQGGQELEETRYFELDYSLPSGAFSSPGAGSRSVEKPVELTPNVQDNEAQEVQDGVNEPDAG